MPAAAVHPLPVATTAKGLEVVDITHPEKPEHTGAVVPWPMHKGVLARLRLRGREKQGLVIVDIERPQASGVPTIYR